MPIDPLSLEQVLELDIDEVRVDPEQHYQFAGVYSFGRGLFARGIIKGSDTSYTKLHRLHTGQIVMSRLKAFEGAVALVPEQFDGSYLSPEFPTLRCRAGLLNETFFSYICKWTDFWAMLRSASKGIGARRERVHPDDLLRIQLRIPDYGTQRVVANHLEALDGNSMKVLLRLSRAADLSTALAVSLATRPDLDEKSKVAEGWQRVPLGSVMKPSDVSISTEPGARYPNVGIYSFGRGLFPKADIDGSTTSMRTLNRISAGQFIYSRLFAFEGAYAHVPERFDGYFVSNEFPSFNPDPERLDSRWLSCYLRSPSRWNELRGSSKGLGVRRQRVPAEAIMAYEVWLPPIGCQRAVVAQLNLLEEAQRNRELSQRQVSALVPAAMNQLFADLV